MPGYPIVNVAAPINWAHPLMAGLVARLRILPFGQWAGGTLIKDLCRAYDGTLTSVSWTGVSRFGNRMALSQTSGSAKVSLGSGLLTSGTDYTMSGWISPDAIGSYYGIFSAYTSDADSMEIFLNPGGTLQFQFSGGVTSTTVLANGAWTHFVATRNNGVGLNLYVNGVLEGVTGTGAFTTPSVAYYLASRSGSFGFSGAYDDFMLHRRGVSAREALSLFNATSQQYDPTLNWLKRRNVKAATASASGGPWPFHFDSELCGGMTAMGL